MLWPPPLRSKKSIDFSNKVCTATCTVWYNATPGCTFFKKTNIESLRTYADITDKEKQVIKCLLKNMTGKEIAANMYLGARTVEWYKERLMEKMEAKSTTGIVIYAIKNNLVQLG